jgi:hypothetical protein
MRFIIDIFCNTKYAIYGWVLKGFTLTRTSLISVRKYVIKFNHCMLHLISIICHKVCYVYHQMFDTDLILKGFSDDGGVKQITII